MCGCNQQAITIGGVDGGECDAPLKFPFPSDVDALKARIALQVTALSLGVSSCGGLSADDRTAWAAFLATWNTFAQQSTPLFGSYGEWVTACAYAHTVDAWRARLDSKCSNVPGPGPISGADMSSVKWVSTALVAVAAIAVVGGGIYAVRMVRG